MEPIDTRYVVIAGKTGKLDKFATRELAVARAKERSAPDDAQYVLELKGVYCAPVQVEYD